MKPDYSNLHYNKNLKEYAHTMRKEGTKAEVCLWKFVLSKKQLKGHTFHRQRPVLHFIADFLCKPLKLVIEVDGSIHDDEEVAARDFIKTNELVTKGYTVLRFTNDDVLLNLELVKNRIEEVVERLSSSDTLGVPPPPPEALGGG